MRRRVAPPFALVVAARHHPSTHQGERPHGDVAVGRGEERLGHGQAHGPDVVEGRVRRPEGFVVGCRSGHGATVGQAAGRCGSPAGRATDAEEVGFEPTVSFPTHDFQSCRFGRSRTPPEAAGRQQRRGYRLWCVVRCSVRRPGPAQRPPVNRVRAGRQQLSAGQVVCRSKPGRRTDHRGGATAARFDQAIPAALDARPRR